MKLITELDIRPSKIELSLSDRILSIGSCFSDEIAHKMQSAGFELLINPFGTIYNPESIAASINRMDSGREFTEQDCVEMGAGARKICSFSHHTSFARSSKEDFLENANSSLQRAYNYWRHCNKVLITLGSAMVWKRGDLVVSNCLKRPGYEFRRERLSLERISELLQGIVDNHKDKSFIFTVSPIRYFSEGAHSNTISKSLLHLAIESLLSRPNCDYFPAYELLCDELRDYRFYARDLVHPNDLTVDIIWQRFQDFCVPKKELELIEANEKAARRAAHIDKR